MALAGNHIIVKLGMTTFDAGDIISLELADLYNKIDITAGSEAVSRAILAIRDCPVTLKGYLTTTVSTGTHHLIEPAYRDESVVDLTIWIGNNAVPNASNGYLAYSNSFQIENYSTSIAANGAVIFTAKFIPIGNAPTWEHIPAA